MERSSLGKYIYRNPRTMNVSPVGGSGVADVSILEGLKFRVERADEPAEYFSEFVSAGT